MKVVDFVYDSDMIFKHVVEKGLKDLNISYDRVLNTGKVEFESEVTQEVYDALLKRLQPYGIIPVLSKEFSLVQKIKACIKMEVKRGNLRNKNLSVILSEKLGYSYPYLSTVFSKETFTTIENFCIFMKIEAVKHLLLTTNKSLTEIANQLDYSSDAHLSRQFKSITGLTISRFVTLIENRSKV